MNSIREDIEELWPELEAGVRYLARKSDENTGRGEEDGVSMTTGATREQLDAAEKRANESWAFGEGMPHVLGPEVRKAAEFLVLPGMVIASVADVAKVPTAEELAAIRELVSNAPGFDETLDALIVVRAYLERVTG